MGQLCSIKSGKSDTKDAVEDGAYAFFDRSRTIKRSSRYLHDCEALIIPGEGTEFLPKHFVGKFDLHQRAYALFDFSERLEVRYLYYFLHHLRDYFPRVAVGATVKSLRLRHFEQLPVTLTSPAEQRRIVGILDEAFAGIAAAKANYEANLRNARALFESHLQSVFSQRGDGWAVQRLGDVCEFVRGPFGGSLKKSNFVSQGYAVYEQRHAIHNRFDNVRYYIDGVKFEEMRRFELYPGDLIMSCSGVTLGRVAVAPTWIERGIINQALLKLSPTNQVSNEFLKHWMSSEAFQEALRQRSGGAAIPNVASVKVLKDIAIPVPPRHEQDRVVGTIRSIATETERLASIYQQKLDALDALKKSLLHDAFRGVL